MEAKATERIILGVDPGTVVMGYGIISYENKKMKLIAMGVLQLDKYDSHALRLKKIFEKTLALIDEYKPDEFAIEEPFFGKNIQSMLKLGRAQGVSMAAALYRGIPIFEYSPRKIKQSVTGKGNSSKEQVASMLQHLLSIKQMPEFLDATDGVAAAVCHVLQGDTVKNGEKKFSGWKNFVTGNPDRVAKKQPIKKT